jgi:hypothetical protein
MTTRHLGTAGPSLLLQVISSLQFEEQVRCCGGSFCTFQVEAARAAGNQGPEEHRDARATWRDLRKAADAILTMREGHSSI